MLMTNVSQKDSTYKDPGWEPAIPDFRPSRWLPGGHAQTVLGSMLPSVELLPQRSIPLTLTDGDQLTVHENLPRRWKPGRNGRPIVLLAIHGLGGCHRSGYVQRLATLANAVGWGSYRMDMRGAGESGRNSRFLYHAGRSDDALEVVRWIRQQHPEAMLLVCGFSLGAAITLHLMAQHASDVEELVEGAVAVAPPLDLLACAYNIRRFKNRMYDRNFSRLLWRTLQQRPQVLEAFRETLPQRCPASLYEFDDQVTAPLGGYESAQEYYQKYSTAGRLSEIRRPTLVIASQDDPLIPYGSFSAIAEAAFVTGITTCAGGHLGFVARSEVARQLDLHLAPWLQGPSPLGPRRWLERAIVLAIARRYSGQSECL